MADLGLEAIPLTRVMTRRAFWLIFLVLVLDNLAWGMVVPVAPSYGVRFGASDQEIGFLYAVYMIVVLPLTLPLGILSDRYGRKPFIIGGLLCLAASTMGYAMADSMALLIIARCFQGLAGALLYSTVFAMVAEDNRPEERGKQLGLLSVAMGIGLIGGPIFGGILAQFLGPSLPFALLAVVLGLLVLPSHLLLVETRRVTSHNGLGVRNVLTNRQVLGVALLTVFGSMVWSIVEALYPKYLTDTFHYDAGTIGVALGIALAGYTIIRPIAGKISDTRGRKPVLVGGFLFVAIVSALIPYADSLPAIVWLLTLTFVGFGFGAASVVPLIADTITDAAIRGNPQGTGSAVTNLAWSSGFALGPLLGGFLVTVVGHGMLFGSYAALLAVSSIASWFWLKEPFSSRILADS